METITFSLGNREEVVRFEKFLFQYAEYKAQFALKHISLVDAYDQLKTREDGGRIFTAILDVQINFILVCLDFNMVGAIWNGSFSKGKLEGGSILDSEEKFFGKMEIHRYSTSYILRYRALWDKLLGLLILIESPEDYEEFIGSRSKNKSFRKIANRNKNIPCDVVQSLEAILTNFDDKFRTAEAHGTGLLRKYSFTMESMANTPQIELIRYWNFLNEIITKLGETLKKK